MKPAKMTYGQLDKVLRSLDFSCRIDTAKPPARIYEHEKSGAIIMLPTLPKANRVYDQHIIVVRLTLENFGLPIPSVFDGKLQTAS